MDGEAHGGPIATFGLVRAVTLFALAIQGWDWTIKRKLGNRQSPRGLVYMADKAVERGGCRFIAAQTADGKPTIAIEVFHTVPSLATTSIAFDLLGGTTLAQAKALAEDMNERILGIVVAHS